MSAVGFGGAPTATVELIDVSKGYPGVVASDRVSLTIAAGEIHCLLGENGAGKSTLVGILAGLVQPDTGTIRVDGVVREISDPRVASELGVGVVHQHPLLVPGLTVLENIVLGTGSTTRYDTPEVRARLGTLLDALGQRIDPDTSVARLPLAEQQRLELAKALWREPRLLVLDEPTSLLGPAEIGELRKVVAELRSQGRAILFITHRLGEALELADRLTVLRNGRVVSSFSAAELGAVPPEERERLIVEQMFGAGPASAPLRESPGASVADAIEALGLSGVSTREQGGLPQLREISLSVGTGEIVGVAGAAGNGQRELARVIAGELRPAAGTIRVFGASLDRLGRAQRHRLGLRYLSDDRLGEGTVGELSVALNLALRRIGRPPGWRRGLLRRKALSGAAAELVREFDIRTPSVAAPVATLSGGNVQKVMLARELSDGARIVICHEPTHGLDRRTANGVGQTLRALAAGGGAALIISTDLDELVRLCDRIVVLSRGRVVGEVERGPEARTRVGALMIGDGP